MLRRLAIALICVAACADEYRDAALKRAEDSVKAATEKASKDPSRPVYHFSSARNIVAWCDIDRTLLELTATSYVSDWKSRTGTLNVSKVIEYSPDGYDVRVESLGEGQLVGGSCGNRKPIWSE